MSAMAMTERRHDRDDNYTFDRGRQHPVYDRGVYDRGFDRDSDRDYAMRDRDRGFDRDYDRGWDRSATYTRDFDRDWNRGDAARDYDRDWDRGWYGRGEQFTRDWDRGYRPGYYGGAYRGLDYNRGYYRRDYDTDYAWDRDRWGWGGTRAGRFAGVGPRNYRRNDDRIKEDVSDRLMRHPDIDAGDIEVDVNNGVVTLKGTVDNRWTKRMAEDTAEAVMGVTDVRNELRVLQQERTWTGGMRSMLGGRAWQLSGGMEVFGMDGDRLGTIKEVRDRDFLLDRPMQRDVFVPFDHIRDAKGDRVMLTVRSADVDNMGWESPPVVQAA